MYDQYQAILLSHFEDSLTIRIVSSRMRRSVFSMSGSPSLQGIPQWGQYSNGGVNSPHTGQVPSCSI